MIDPSSASANREPDVLPNEGQHGRDHDAIARSAAGEALRKPAAWVEAGALVELAAAVLTPIIGYLCILFIRYLR